MFRNSASKCILATSLALVAFVPLASAKKIKPEQVLYDFCALGGACSDGARSTAGLIMDSSGNFYGTASEGGNANGQCAFDCGVVFKLAPDGTETVLYTFCSEGGACSDGAMPTSSLIADSSGNFYGTTHEGGVQDCFATKVGCGTVFKLAPDGTETVLYTFCTEANCTDGGAPDGSLIMDGAGNLYGTTQLGGANGLGTVFQIAADGTETVLYSFCSQANCSDGNQPYAGLIMDGSGNLYGTTASGGLQKDGCGTVFELAPDGTETVLHAFASGAGDGCNSNAGLLADASGNLYGTTTEGGTNDEGTVFELAPDGTETLLHSFVDGSDGATPVASLIADSAGNLYGTTELGGNASCKKHTGCGTVFELAPDGTETVLYAFKSQKYGVYPEAGLIADQQGNLYSTTFEGGLSKYGAGVVFKINIDATAKH